MLTEIAIEESYRDRQAKAKIFTVCLFQLIGHSYLDAGVHLLVRISRFTL